MNQKQAYRTTEPRPVFLYEVDVDVEVRGRITGHRLVRGTEVNVIPKPGLIRGWYELLYAERSQDGTILMAVEGPTSRVVHERYRKIIRERDIKGVRR